MTILALLLATFVGPVQDTPGPEIIRVGHWLEVRGNFDEQQVLRAGDVELLPAEDYEILIGTVTEKKAEGEFLFHGQPVHVSRKTDFGDFSGDEDDLAGKRVKIEGYWRDNRKFSAREIADRGPGRERIAGRVDDIRSVEGGYEARIMSFRVFIPEDVDFEAAPEWHRIPLIPPRGSFLAVPPIDSFTVRTGGKDEEDLFGKGIELYENLFFSAQIEGNGTYEDDFNLFDDDPKDRRDFDLRTRSRMVYVLSENVAFTAEFSHNMRYRNDEDEAVTRTSDTTLGETFVYWRDFLVEGLDIQVGRQDFDEKREWIFDQNLDAIRAVKTFDDLVAELSVSTIFADEGNATDRQSHNLIGYLSSDDLDRHLAGWFVARDIDTQDVPPPNPSRNDDLLRDDFVQVGARAIGDWLPDNESWIDVAVHDFDGLAFDIGTTWELAETPFYFTAGYAFASKTYRQTGFADNNDKFGGVTSFKYYGELFEPELANMHIATLGAGALLAEETSLDLVWHHYRQTSARDVLGDTQIDPTPSGVDEDLGWELDLILGCRRWSNLDIEVVGAYFSAGDAFTEPDDDALLVKLQLRYRF